VPTYIKINEPWTLQLEKYLSLNSHSVNQLEISVNRYSSWVKKIRLVKRNDEYAKLFGSHLIYENEKLLIKLDYFIKKNLNLHWDYWCRYGIIWTFINYFLIFIVTPTNPHWARVVGPFSLCVIHKEGLCPTSGDINRLMMIYCQLLFTLM
jgi:hypothetical protein